jgi:hypothetical protein
MKRSSIRDFAAVEAGFFSYQVLGFYENSDSTLVFPTVLTLRYGLTFAKIFEPYLYGGLMKNFAIAQSPNAGVAQASLSSLRPAFGAGVAVKFKGFLARGDYGYDMLGAGVGYQF